MKKKKYVVTADLEYVEYLRSGYIEALLTEEEYEEFKALSEDEQADYLVEVGDVVIDDARIEGLGPLQNIKVTEVN